MRIQPILTATILSALTAVAADAKRVRIDAVSLVLDGQPVSARPADPDLAAIYDATVPTLRNKGFVILRTSNKADMTGGTALGDLRIGTLSVDLRPPAFTFNVVIVPQWNKAKAGRIELRTERGAELWATDVRVSVQLAEGKQRRDYALAELPGKLRDISPSARLKVRRDAVLTTLLKLNDIDIDAGRFVDFTRGLLAANDSKYAAALIELAADPRLSGLADLRIELVRRAVVSGADGIEATIGRVLAREMIASNADPALTELMIEGLALLGASVGDVLAPYAENLGLDDLLALRERFPLQSDSSAMDRRIELLGVAAAEAMESFADSERLIRRLPLPSLSQASRVRLRDALFALTTRPTLAELYPRIIRLFPESEYPPLEVDHLEDGFVAGATDLVAAAVEQRETYLRDYLRYSPSGRSVDRMVSLLALEPALAARMDAGLQGAATAEAEKSALTEAYGRHVGPRGRASFGRALVRALGPQPRDGDVLALLARQPDVPEVGQRARELGLVRDRDTHVFPVPLGADGATVTAALGAGHRIDAMRRQDLSPGGVVSARSRVPGSDRRGFAVLDYEKQQRILLKDDVVFRIIIDDSMTRYHHGVRTGDTRSELVAALGEPSETRALMFGRDLLTWNNVARGQHVLTAVVDDGRASILYEDDPGLTKTSLAALW